jgi:hypothetical protein
MNNVIYGSLDEELLLYEDPDGVPVQTKRIEACLLKTKILGLAINGNILNRDPRFKNISKFDYEPESNSPCANTGIASGVFFDLKGRSRNAVNPSIGAYEVQ